MLNIASSVIPAGRGDSVIVSAHAITGQLSFIVLVDYYCPILILLACIFSCWQLPLPSRCARIHNLLSAHNLCWSAYYLQRLPILTGRLNISGPIILAGRLYLLLVRSILPARLYCCGAHNIFVDRYSLPVAYYCCCPAYYFWCGHLNCLLVHAGTVSFYA